MDFKLTPDQLELQRVARDYAQKELPALADELEESGEPVPKDALMKIGEMGGSGGNTFNGQKPEGVIGYIRYNNTNHEFEGFGGSWSQSTF